MIQIMAGIGVIGILAFWSRSQVQAQEYFTTSIELSFGTVRVLSENFQKSE